MLCSAMLCTPSITNTLALKDCSVAFDAVLQIGKLSLFSTLPGSDCIITQSIIQKVQEYIQNFNIEELIIRAHEFIGPSTTLDLSDCMFMTKLDIKFQKNTKLTVKLPRKANLLSDSYNVESFLTRMIPFVFSNHQL